MDKLSFEVATINYDTIARLAMPAFGLKQRNNGVPFTSDVLEWLLRAIFTLSGGYKARQRAFARAIQWATAADYAVANDVDGMEWSDLTEQLIGAQRCHRHYNLYLRC